MGIMVASVFLLSLAKESSAMAIPAMISIGILAAIEIGVLFAVIKASKEGGFNEGGGAKIWQALAVMGGVTAALIGTAALLGVANTVLVPGMIGALALAGVVTSIGFTLNKVLEINKIVEDNPELNPDANGQTFITKRIRPIFDELLSVITSVDASFGGLIKSGMVMNSVKKAINCVTTIVNDMIALKDAGITAEESGQYTKVLTGTIKSFMDAVMKMLNDITDDKGRSEISNKAIRQQRKIINRVKQLINVSKSLLKIIRDFDTDSQAGNNIINSAEIAATNISNAINIFIGTITDMFENLNSEEGKISNKSLRQQKKVLKRVNELLNISRNLLNMIGTFDTESAAGNNIIESAQTSAVKISKALLAFAQSFFGDEGDNEIISGSIRRVRKELKAVKELVNITGNFMKLLGGIKAETAVEMEEMSGFIGLDDKERTKFANKGMQISTCLLTFVKGFFDGFDSLSDLTNKELKRTKKELKRVKQLINIVPDFIKMLTAYTDLTSGENAVTNEELIKNGEGLATLIGNFCDIVFGKLGELADPGRIKKHIKNISAIAGPIQTLIDMISSYKSEDGKTLNKVIVNADGTVSTTEAIDVTQVSKAIVGALTTFLETLYDKENIKK